MIFFFLKLQTTGLCQISYHHPVLKSESEIGAGGRGDLQLRKNISETAAAEARAAAASSKYWIGFSQGKKVGNRFCCNENFFSWRIIDPCLAHMQRSLSRRRMYNKWPCLVRERPNDLQDSPFTSKNLFSFFADGRTGGRDKALLLP